MQDRTLTVALVGNPNSGKTTLSNCLTGAHDSVANYPRVTVSKHTREVRHKGWTLKLVDLPGIYSLTSQSPEERIGRDFIQDERPDILLNVLDAGNLDRSLFLTTQLIETGRPHQIRVQLAAIAQSIVGDVRYGSEKRLGSMIALHASAIAFPHPVSKEMIEVECELPENWKELLRKKSVR